MNLQEGRFTPSYSVRFIPQGWQSTQLQRLIVLTLAEHCSLHRGFFHFMVDSLCALSPREKGWCCTFLAGLAIWLVSSEISIFQGNFNIPRQYEKVPSGNKETIGKMKGNKIEGFYCVAPLKKTNFSASSSLTNCLQNRNKNLRRKSIKFPTVKRTICLFFKWMMVVSEFYDY